MARLVQRQNSDGLSDRNHFGCMGLFLQYLDERHLLHSKNLLEESETGDAKQPPTMKGSGLYSPFRSNQHDKSHGESNLKVSKKNSGKALRDLISKKLFRKPQRKHKMLPVTPHLLRTFSIHHLECNDYVIAEEPTVNEEALESLESDPSRTSKQVSYLEEDIKSKACRSADTVKSSFRKASSTLAECDLDGALPDASSGIDMHTSEPAVINSYFPNNQMHQGTPLNRLTNVIHDNRKEILRISMDSLLHKVPYGQKMPKNISRRNLFRSISAGSSRDVSSDNIGILPKVYPYRRSHSLTESLDQYADLLNSISIRESKKNLEPLNSIKKYNNLQEKKTPRRFERIHSDPEFRSYHPSPDSQRLFHASLSLKEPSIIPLDADKGINCSAKPDLSETAPYMKDKMQSDKYIAQNQIMNSRGRTDRNLLEEVDESDVKINESEKSETCKVTNSTVERAVYTQKDNGDLERSFLANESDQIEFTDFSDTKQKGNGFIALHPSDEPTKQNHVFDLDSHLEEEIVSPPISKDSEHRNLLFEECDYFPKPVNDLDVDAPSGAQIVESSSTGKQPESNSDAFCIKLDQKDGAEFQYVRDVLTKLGFDSVEFVGAWYSQFMGPYPFLFDKENRIFDKIEPESDNSGDASLDHQLLSDLINEVLLEIYEKCFVHDWFLRVLPNVRPIPMGDHLLKEVWMKMSSLLSYQRQLVHTMEDMMTREFAKSDGWLNLQWDAEYVGMELESLIMDDLLDEFLMPDITGS